MRDARAVAVAAVAAVVLAAGCAGPAAPRTATGPAARPAPIPPTSAPSTPVPAPTGADAVAAQVPTVPIPLRFESRVPDVPVEAFAAEVMAILTDLRGWQQAGFAFSSDPDAPYVIVLAEGPEVDALCLPYTTGGRYSCQIGPVVALNADRWRAATETWPTDLATYRTMLVTHEVGHLIGQHHVRPKCAAPGQPAAAMAQQSASLDGCLPGPWPQPWEIACAAMHVEQVAPPYEPDARRDCGPPSG